MSESSYRLLTNLRGPATGMNSICTRNSSRGKAGGDMGAFLGINPRIDQPDSSGSLSGAKKLLSFWGISGRKLDQIVVGKKVNMARRIIKRQSTSLRRKQIIDALRKLIIEYGSENVTVRRIAKEIGVSQGAIYRHFKSKRQILDFLVDYIEENLIGDVEKSDSHVSTLEVLENILKSHISAIEQRKGVSFLIVAEIVSLGDKRLNKKIYEVLKNYMNHIKNVLLRGVKAGEINPEIDLDMAATVFLGIIQGLVTLWALSNYNFTLEEKYFGLWDFFRKSVRSQST
jgi:AcrR family transcriptional regulator